MPLKELEKKIKQLPSPWCGFSLEKEFKGFITTRSDYDCHGLIRKLIYEAYYDDPSISLGALPPILSPMFWEVVSGKKREEIKSLKYPGKCISEEAYQRHLRLWDYQPRIFKVYLVNPQAYQESLLERYKAAKLDNDGIVEDIKRRLHALDLFIGSLQKGEWPKLLLNIPAAPVPDKDRSFTITHHMEVELTPGKGVDSHNGFINYYPQTNAYLKKEWAVRWDMAKKYVEHRDDWPELVNEPEDVLLQQEKCRQFNIGSIEIAKKRLDDMKKRYSPHQTDKPTEYDAFICHASEDKLAIVKDFHEACRDAGINTWYDNDEIGWGDQIVTKINEGLAKSRFVIVFVTKHSVKKEWVKKELNAALSMAVKKGQFVLPVFLGVKSEEVEQTYPFLAGLNYKFIAFYDPAVKVKKDEIAKLVQALKKELNRK